MLLASSMTPVKTSQLSRGKHKLESNDIIGISENSSEPQV